MGVEVRTPPVSFNPAQAAVQRVLSSRTFARNPRLTALFTYLCEKSLAGTEQSIKEYDIATDVFRRPTSFDQSRDAIVRVEMHRLRKKLREYYADEGLGDPIEIVLQTGKYLPDFIERGELERSDSSEPVDTEVLDEPPEKALTTPLVPTSVRKRPLPVVWIVVLLVALAGIGGGLFWLNHAHEREIANSRAQAALASSPTMRLLCGLNEGTFQDRAGNLWGPDAYYLGGSAIRLPSTPVYRTRDAGLYRTARTGDFSYRIPLKPGNYELRLYFDDTSYRPGIDMEGGEGTRYFLIRANGATLLDQFDIIADAGPNTADVRVFKDISPDKDGYLHLSFQKEVGEPLLNAISIRPGTPHRMTPVYITTQDRKFVDHSGVEWQPDNYFLGGRISSRYGVIAGAADPQIYERERYGHFSYAIPVAAGRYDVTLYLAESFWGPGQPGGGGTGSRLFDVYCNGNTLIKNFDMFKEAGADHQIAKTFYGVPASAQGTLLLSFVPTANYASLSAIRVLDEGTDAAGK